VKEFDSFARNYSNINDQFSGFFGEKTEYFARYKAHLIHRWLGPDFAGSILDFGCGIGLVTTSLVDFLPKARLTGFDYSPASIREAKRLLTQRNKGSQLRKISYCSGETKLSEEYDVIVLANVMHHVPPPDREDLLGRLFDRLHPSGTLMLFEHNTDNWLVIRELRHHPFDEIASFLPPKLTQRLLTDAGFNVRRKYIVFFPAFLSRLRFMEPHLWWLPIGAQYMCIATKKTF
jgi:2-polyprenyl-3-methyl-5-hydroxy-6-metoxy-1,4-benzoquinol methylase